MQIDALIFQQGFWSTDSNGLEIFFLSSIYFLVHGPTILLFFRCFFWRSGLLECWSHCWIRSYVQGHWFGCSLRPGTPLYSPWKLDSSARSWSLTYLLRSNNGSCSRKNNLHLSTYPRRKIPADMPHGIKASSCVHQHSAKIPSGGDLAKKVA